jgi:hypothetical protein
MIEKFKKVKSYSNPVDYFNREITFEELIAVLTIKGQPIFSERNGKYYDNNSLSVKDPAELKHLGNGRVLLTQPNSLHLPQDIQITFFEIFCQARFNGNWQGCANYIHLQIMKQSIPFISIGGDYFRIIKRKNALGTETIKIKPYKKDEIKEEYGKASIQLIPRFADYTNEPDNTSAYQQVHGDYYNVYNEVFFRPLPKPKPFPHIQLMMEHIFGEQIELGYRYLQCLYLHPKQILPILCLVSEKRDTGKTTFMDFIQMWLGENCVPLDPKALTDKFNSIYANKLMILVDETMLEKQSAIERLKSIATQKTMSVNMKFVAEYTVDFYGKIIIASNMVKKFMRIDEEEIRFWVRAVPVPKTKVTDILKKMHDEIPALLHYLESLPEIDFSRSRMVFTKEEIKTDALDAVMQESYSGLRKELQILIQEHFNEYPNLTEFYATATDIKDKWFANNNQIGRHYISSVLTEEMKMERSEGQIQYYPFGIHSGTGEKRNRAFRFANSVCNEIGVQVTASYSDELLPF